ncbi:MAG: hypothetical protein WCG98_10485 [bacterium]
MLESLDQDLLARDEKFSFDPNEVYYYNAQRGKELILRLQSRYTEFDEQGMRGIFHEAMGIDDIVDIRCNTSFGTGHIVAFVDTTDHTYVYRQTV